MKDREDLLSISCRSAPFFVSDCGRFLDTEDLVLVAVDAPKIAYCRGEEEGNLHMPADEILILLSSVCCCARCVPLLLLLAGIHLPNL